ncbi:MAG: methionyl-tRNA formyltransferase [Treponema sp.]|nr:methionyl-tRNA formyltransferase [Treponema sp.]
MKKPAGLRILFAGSPAIALPSLRMIADGARAGRWLLTGIVTNPDTHRGRGRAGTEPTDVGLLAAQLAEEFTAQETTGSGLNVPALLKYETLKTEAREAVSWLKPDLLVSFAYGRLFGPKFLALFPLGGINIHPSLLPKYRGASPIQETILRRDSETGISIQRIAAEMDTGNILAQEIIPLTGRETAASLSETAAEKGAELLQKVLEQFRQIKNNAAQNTAPEGSPQRGESSYCTLLEKDSGLIDWNRSAPEIDAQIRACNPWPLARTSHNGQTINILTAVPYPGFPPQNDPGAVSTVPGGVLGIDKKSGILIQTGKGILAVSLLQYQTRKVLSWQAFLNGARDFIGSRLTGGS